MTWVSNKFDIFILVWRVWLAWLDFASARIEKVKLGAPTMLLQILIDNIAKCHHSCSYQFVKKLVWWQFDVGHFNNYNINWPRMILLLEIVPCNFYGSELFDHFWSTIQLQKVPSHITYESSNWWDKFLYYLFYHCKFRPFCSSSNCKRSTS